MFTSLCLYLDKYLINLDFLPGIGLKLLIEWPQGADGANSRGEVHERVVWHPRDVRHGLHRDLRRVQSERGRQDDNGDEILRQREFTFGKGVNYNYIVTSSSISN